MSRLAIESQTAHAARVFTDALSSRFDVAEARLFGSRARGNHGPESDADVAVLLRGPRGDFVATKLAMADIAFDTMLETGLLIEPLPIWLDEWARPAAYRNPRLLENIARRCLYLNSAEFLAKAKKAVRSARVLLDAGDTDGACNRAYYAMFDAAGGAHRIIRAGPRRDGAYSRRADSGFRIASGEVGVD